MPENIPWQWIPTIIGSVWLLYLIMKPRKRRRLTQRDRDMIETLRKFDEDHRK